MAQDPSWLFALHTMALPLIKVPTPAKLAVAKI